MKRQALMAIAFAAGMLSSQLPALSGTTSESSESVIQEIVDSKQMPELRAYYLLKLANCYIDGRTKTDIEAQFGPIWK